MRADPKEIMPVIHNIIDSYVGSKSSFYQAAIRPYLPELSSYILIQLGSRGYFIDKEIKPGHAIVRHKK